MAHDDPEMNKKLEDILSGMGIAAPEPAPPPPAEKPPVEPAPAPPPAAQAPSSGLIERFEKLENRLRETEVKLAEAQGTAIAATVRLQEKEAAQKEMEAMFQSLRAQQRTEETHQLEREMAAKMQARIQALEERLDKQLSEMQSSWTASVQSIVSSLRETLKEKPPPQQDPAIPALVLEVQKTRQELDPMRREQENHRLQLEQLEGKIRQTDARDSETRALIGAAGSRIENALAQNEADRLRFKAHLDALHEGVGKLTESARTLDRRQEAFAEQGGKTTGELETLSKELASLKHLPDAVMEMRQGTEERLSAIEHASDDLWKNQQELSQHASLLSENLEQAQRALGMLEKAWEEEAAGIKEESGARADSLERGAKAMSKELEDSRKMLRTLEAALDARIGDLQAGWAGVLASLNDIVLKIKKEAAQEVAPYRFQLEDLERKISSMESAWSILSRSIPEGVLRQVKHEVFKMESRIAELEEKLIKKGI